MILGSRPVRKIIIPPLTVLQNPTRVGDQLIYKKPIPVDNQRILTEIDEMLFGKKFNSGALKQKMKEMEMVDIYRECKDLILKKEDIQKKLSNINEHASNCLLNGNGYTNIREIIYDAEIKFKRIGIVDVLRSIWLIIAQIYVLLGIEKKHHKVDPSDYIYMCIYMLTDNSQYLLFNSTKTYLMSYILTTPKVYSLFPNIKGERGEFLKQKTKEKLLSDEELNTHIYLKSFNQLFKYNNS